MRLVLVAASLFVLAAPIGARAAEPRGICVTEPSRVMHFDRANVKKAIESSIAQAARPDRPVRFEWIPSAHADARRAGCDAIVRVALRGRRSRTRFDFVATLPTATGFAVMEEVGPVDLARIDPRSFAKLWRRLFARLDPEALTRADD